MLALICSLLHDDFYILMLFLLTDRAQIVFISGCPLVSLFVFTYVLYLLFDIWTLFVPV